MRKARGRAVFADGLRPLRPLDEEENLGVYVAKVKRADAPVAGHEVTFHWYVLFTFAFQTLAAPPQLMVNGFGVATGAATQSSAQETASLPHVCAQQLALYPTPANRDIRQRYDAPNKKAPESGCDRRSEISGNHIQRPFTSWPPVVAKLSVPLQCWEERCFSSACTWRDFRSAPDYACC